MSKRVAGITCPRCLGFCYELADGTMSKHKTKNFVMGQKRAGRIRETCVYSNGTWQDAKDKIPPWKRRMLDDDTSEAQ
jgi:hypothetical protein